MHNSCLIILTHALLHDTRHHLPLSFHTLTMDSPSSIPQKNSTMKIIIGVVVAFLVLMAGCRMITRSVGEKMVEKMIENGSGVKTDVDMKNGSMKFTNEEGTVTTGNALPDDWPKDIPTYPGATIQFSGTANPDNEAPGMATMMTTADSADAVATFYQTAMKNGGWKIESTMKMGEGTILVGSKDTRNLSIAIGSYDNSQTSITIGVQMQ